MAVNSANAVINALVSRRAQLAALAQAATTVERAGDGPGLDARIHAQRQAAVARLDPRSRRRARRPTRSPSQPCPCAPTRSRSVPTGRRSWPRPADPRLALDRPSIGQVGSCFDNAAGALRCRPSVGSAVPQQLPRNSTAAEWVVHARALQVRRRKAHFAILPRPLPSLRHEKPYPRGIVDPAGGLDRPHHAVTGKALGPACHHQTSHSIGRHEGRRRHERVATRARAMLEGRSLTIVLQVALVILVTAGTLVSGFSFVDGDKTLAVLPVIAMVAVGLGLLALTPFSAFVILLLARAADPGPVEAELERDRDGGWQHRLPARAGSLQHRGGAVPARGSRLARRSHPQWPARPGLAPAHGDARVPGGLRAQRRRVGPTSGKCAGGAADRHGGR